MVATYTSIASEFKNQADGALVLTAYQLGYSVALTVVSRRFPLRLILWSAMGWLAWECKPVRREFCLCDEGELLLIYWSVIM